MKRKRAAGTGSMRKGDISLMFLFLVIAVVMAVVLLGGFVGSYFSFVYKFINIKEKLGIFMVNDDAGTELISLLNAKNGSVRHIEFLGSYLDEYSDISPVKSTLETAFLNYDFTYNGIGSVNFKKGVPSVISDTAKSAIVGCGVAAGGQISLKWPLDTTYNTVTSGFGGRELNQGQCDCHGGIDIRAPVGTSVYAAAQGIVHAAGSGCIEGGKTCNGGYGNYVAIEHSVNGNKYYSYYVHLQDVKVVKKGDDVAEGTLIGTTGNTGYSEGPHLHFELRSSGNRPDKDSINPCGLFVDQSGQKLAMAKCSHELVAACKYVAGMVSGNAVRSYDTDIPLPGAKSGNVKGTVVFKQW